MPWYILPALYNHSFYDRCPKHTGAAWHATVPENEYNDEFIFTALQKLVEWGKGGGEEWEGGMLETAEEEVKWYANPAFHLPWLLYENERGNEI